MGEAQSVITSNEDNQKIRMVEDFWNDRVGFVKCIIGVTPTDQQGDALLALDRADHVSVKSGHGCGKSGVQSWVGLHYMSCRPFPKVPCTAPSKHQLYDVLWAELSKWHRQLNPLFASQFQWTKERFFHRNHPEEWFMVARTATKENPEALQGFHADYILRIIDEASGVPEAIFEVSDGAHGRLETKELMCGNPTRLEGTFYESFRKNRAEYEVFSWSCLDSSIAPSAYAAKMERKYGKDSNVYRVRVLGDFPLHDTESFIAYDLAEDALLREIPPQDGKPKVFGVDVARFGDDDTVIAIRQGDEFKPMHVLKGKGTMEVAGYVAFLANQEKPQQIFVDVIGIGSGVYDRLYELGFPVVAVNVSESPATNPQMYKRLRDELWGNMRDWLKMRRGRIYDNEDRDLIGQLTTPKYKFTSDGKIVIESKDDMKKRGLSSPNHADAAIMTFAQPMNEYSKDADEFFDDLYGRGQNGFQPLDTEAGY